MEIAARQFTPDGEDRYRIYDSKYYYDGSVPLRELIIQLLARRRNEHEFYIILTHEEVEMLKNKYEKPFVKKGSYPTIYYLLEVFLLVDFNHGLAANAFCVCPHPLKQPGIAIRCINSEHMIYHAKRLLAKK